MRAARCAWRIALRCVLCARCGGGASPALTPRIPQPSSHTHTLLRQQFPTKAADAQGEHGRQLPTLEDEYRRARLEAAIDAELERLARVKTEQGGGSKGKK